MSAFLSQFGTVPGDLAIVRRGCVLGLLHLGKTPI